MPMTNDAASVVQAGMSAWRDGKYEEARRLFEGLAKAGKADALVWLGLAHVYRDLNQSEKMFAALDRVLQLEPRNLNALLMKADHYAAGNDAARASMFFGAVVRAAPPLNQLSAGLRREVERAHKMCDHYAQTYERFLRDKLAASGFQAGQSTRRFEQSIDIACGKAQAYFQQPTRYYFPGLPQIQFYERDQFPWLKSLEASTGDIRGELSNVLRDDTGLQPYIETGTDIPHLNDTSLADNPAWSAFYLIRDSEVVEENAVRCPKTMAAIKNAPLARIRNRMPSVLFSVLRPGARIPPHHGLVNVRLICHLPLIVPEKCGFRVGNETREWEVGKALIFDDSIEHEAWNDSGETRVVLLFDIERPEMTQEENQLVSAMFEAIDAYGSGG